MTEGAGGTPPPEHAARPGMAGATAREMLDWITIWQSELASLATDRELQEGWARMIDLWAEAASRAARLMPGLADASPGSTGPEPAPRPAPAMAAPDARDAAIQRLADRVEELERRLRALPGGSDDIPGRPARP
jgi:hypothetical protein